MPKTPRKPAATDWERLQREATQELPIADAAVDGPDDPNDAAAVNADAFNAPLALSFSLVSFQSVLL